MEIFQAELSVNHTANLFKVMFFRVFLYHLFLKCKRKGINVEKLSLTNLPKEGLNRDIQIKLQELYKMSLNNILLAIVLENPLFLTITYRYPASTVPAVVLVNL